jgi:hypothetical protein
MKKIFITLSALALFTVSCNNDGSGHDGQVHAAMILEEKFNENCETVRSYIEGLQSENVDYSLFADDFYRINTAFRAKQDTVTLTEFIDSRVNFAAAYDVELIIEPVLLPGVLAETGEPNGSVRYYSQWRLTTEASDEKPSKEAVIKLYESFDFNEEGKISINMVYGDFTAMFQYLND